MSRECTYCNIVYMIYLCSIEAISEYCLGIYNHGKYVIILLYVDTVDLLSETLEYDDINTTFHREGFLLM